MILYYESKDPEEVINVLVGWSKVLRDGETIDSARWTLDNLDNPSEDTASMISGIVDFSTHPNTIQCIIGGTAGCRYLHRSVITTSDGRTLVQGVEQLVKRGG